MKKILIYSHDTFGLGNIRRMLTIAQYLVDTKPDYSILILSGSPMLHAFRIPERIDYVKLPCLARDQSGAYHVRSLDMDYQALVNLRANLIMSTVLDFQPDLILVDKKPLGLSNELAPAMEIMSRRQRRPKVVLLLRDILDSGEVTARTWEKNGYHEAIEAYYDLVLVVGSPEIFDLCEEYRFPASSRDRVRYCGYLRRERGRSRRGAVRSNLRVGREPLVLVTAGGGADGFQLMSSYLQGLSTRSPADETRSLLLCGPEMSEAHRRQITARASRAQRVQVHEFSDDPMSLMEASDLVVSMGGYNTVCEILSLNKRAVIVPRFRPVQEQWIRCQRLSKLGLMHSIHPDELTGEGLINAVHEQLQSNGHLGPVKGSISLNGLSTIGQWLDYLLADRSLSPVFRQGLEPLKAHSAVTTSRHESVSSLFCTAGRYAEGGLS